MTDRIEELLSIYLLDPDSMNEQQIQTLSGWIKQDQKNARIFIDSMLFRRDIHDLMLCSDNSINNLLLNSHEAKKSNSDSSMFDMQLMHSLLENELQAPEVLIDNVDRDKTKEQISETVKDEMKIIKTNKFSRLYNAIVSIAAVLMILFIVYANIFPPSLSVSVATVTDQLGVEWNKTSSRLNNGERVLTNQLPYKIEKGIIQFTYDEGVDITIEGPAEFTVENKGLEIKYGRLYSYVTDIGHGFTVDTPYIRFVDLGTEFGVLVGKDISTELHVMEGAVQYFSGLPGTPKVSKKIRKDNARRFDAENGEVVPIPMSNEYFARKVNSDTGIVWRGEKHLDMVNLLADDKGLNKPGDIVGIGLLEGKYVTFDKYKEMNTNNKYQLFNSSEIIDGVFIPDGGSGSVTIASNGLTFDCPDTQGNNNYNIFLFKGGVKRQSSISPAIFNGNNVEDYPESFLCMHSNCGITIDLQAVKRSIGNMKIAGFNAWGGITEYVATLGGREADVDFWILVDGKVRYEMTPLKIADGIIDFDIELNSQDRFLTLIVTDGLRPTDTGTGLAKANDFFYLVNPQLQLESE